MTDIPEDFRRSSRFGLIGVGVVMVVTAAIALLFGSNSANPTGALIAIFAVVFGFVGVMLYLQRRDVDGAEARSKRDSLASTEPVTDPTTATPMSLLADLATGPVDRAAIAAAEGGTWAVARRSIGSGAFMVVLIGCAVIPFELTHELWSMVVFVPAILIYAVYLAARVFIPGGTLDTAYSAADPTIAALGLASQETDGAVVYAGERCGRTVSVRIDAAGATTEVAGSVAGFEVRARGERLRADAQSPPAVAAVLEPLRASSYWSGVVVRGGNHGVTVERSGTGAGEHWTRDLWLAEHLADAARR